jgi:hypothetical protein
MLSKASKEDGTAGNRGCWRDQVWPGLVMDPFAIWRMRRNMWGYRKQGLLKVLRTCFLLELAICNLDYPRKASERKAAVFSIFFLFYGTGIWIQGLELTRQGFTWGDCFFKEDAKMASKPTKMTLNWQCANIYHAVGWILSKNKTQDWWSGSSHRVPA